MRFKGKVAIVTGGSSGIGKETAKRLVAEGASVVLSGKDDAKLQSAAREIGGTASQVVRLAGDIAKPATGAALVELAKQEFGGLDILVSNAGVFRPKPFNEITEEEYDWFLDTILDAVQLSLEVAHRRKNPADPFDHAQVRMVKRIMPRH